MLAASAHSFAQQARLAVSLSWIGGYTNALSIVACSQVTSHLTGAVSQFGVGVAKGTFGAAGYMAALVATFTAGAFAAGLLLEWARARRWQRVFALPIAVEVGLLAAFAGLLALGSANGTTDGALQIAATLVAAFAMGLQNATITRISGGVVRTTHVTGVATDLGLDLARSAARGLGWNRPLSAARRAVAWWRLLLLGSIPLSFALGAGLGTLAFEHAPGWAALPPIGFLLLVLLLQLWHRTARIELVPVAGAGGPQVGVFRAVPPPGAEEYAFGDLGLWASHTDPQQRTLVLDVAALPTLDETAALELRALMRHLREERRFLVLCGVEQGQLQALDDAGVLLDFDADDLCHDRHAAEVRAFELATGR
ncbi:MAG: DUF1275 family protein [Planctomycetes bacterium]|jgi:uncharacterized membrane protein YoaK (UPF0700 family)|nr:DUF1275 family protein [Planctomycetota bacterium]